MCCLNVRTLSVTVTDAPQKGRLGRSRLLHRGDGAQDIEDLHRGQNPPYSNLAGDEKGRAASTTNMTSWSRSDVPALKTSIAMSAPCPFIA